MAGCKQYENRVFKSGREPKAAFWDGLNCTGESVELEAGDYPSLFYLESGKHDMGNKISSMWIPPHMATTLFSRTGCTNWRKECANTTCRCSGANMWNYAAGYNQYPFEYQAGGYPAIGQTPGNNNAEAIKLELTNNWDDFLDNCCRGKTGNGVSKENCGPFWRGTSETETGSCDFRMQEYCDVNPNDPLCACYEEPIIDPNNKEEACLKVFPKCYSTKCATRGYKPFTMKDIQCPKCTFCTQNINIQGKQNVFNDNVILMECGVDTGGGGGGTTATEDKDGNIDIRGDNVKTNVNIDPSTVSTGNAIGEGGQQSAADIIAAKEAAKAAERSANQEQLLMIFIGLLAFALLWGYLNPAPPLRGRGYDRGYNRSRGRYGGAGFKINKN